MPDTNSIIAILITIAVLIVITRIARMEWFHLLGGIIGSVAGYYYINGIFGVIIGGVVGFIFGAGAIMYGGWGGGGSGGWGGFGGGSSGGGGAGRDF
ncbi:MAG TPA: hypothetical protein VMD02_01110 [Candidatus Omnitrophota bacterium]|nr:hypothetical protein [Candidatus Omnitrophota bacterium]